MFDNKENKKLKVLCNGEGKEKTGGKLVLVLPFMEQITPRGDLLI